MKKYLQSFLMGMVLLPAVASAQIGKCKGKYFGNIIANTVHSNYTTNWNQLTMENASKWQSTEPSIGRYDFRGSDIGYNWAKNNKGMFKYHALMWGAQTPGWVPNASSATIQAAIEPYFKAVADHYGPMGGLSIIDVLNEPINTPVAANLKNALTAGYQAEPANAGDRNNQYGWAIWCFQLARKYFPNSTLLINEFNIEMNWNNCRAPYIAMSNAIKNAPNLTDGKKNLIDGIGLQAHGINNLTAANFKACIDEIWNKTGLAIHITEFDQTADPNEAKQKEVYERLIPVAWEHPRVAGITFWGYIQGATWIGGNRQTGPGGTDSGIMYANGNDRPAMTWLRSYMASRPNLPCCPAPAPFAACNGSNAPTVSITAPANNAVYTQGANIMVTATAADQDGTVSKVEFYNGTTKLGEDLSSPFTYTLNNASVGTYSLTAVATDNSGNKTTSTVVVVRVNVPQGAYNNIVHLIPGRIEAEHYDVGGEGSAYHEVNANGNEGGASLRSDEVDIEATQDATGAYNVAYILNGEWLEYTVNVSNTDVYDLELRMAAEGAGKTLHVEMDGVNITGPIAVPNTASWQTWQTATVTKLNLTAGQKVMRIAFDADYMNLNYVAFKRSTVTGLQEGETLQGVSVFPNPFHEEGLQVVVAENTNYQIFNIMGQELESGQVQGSTLLGQSLVKGTYVLKLYNGNKVHITKINKQ